MGLLERLTATDHDKDSPFARVLQMRGPASPAGEGLFSSDSPVPGGAVDTRAAVRALLREVHRQHEFGIATPSHLFSILHRHLHVTSGAILVREPGRSTYVPIAAAGIDPQTRSHMRIPLETMNLICADAGAVILQGPELAVLEPYLATDAAAPRPARVAVLPFFYNRENLATLLVFDSPFLDLSVEVLDVLLGAFSERAGYLLFDGRQKPFSAAENVTVHEATELETVLAGLSSDPSPGDLVAVKVSLTPLLRVIESLHKHLDRRYLLNDVLATCALLTTDQYSLVTLGEGEFVLLGERNPRLDTELLVQLLGTTLQQLFGVGPTIALQFKSLDPDSLLSDR